jgi:hypothetical protein
LLSPNFCARYRARRLAPDAEALVPERCFPTPSSRGFAGVILAADNPKSSGNFVLGLDFFNIDQHTNGPDNYTADLTSICIQLPSPVPLSRRRLCVATSSRAAPLKHLPTTPQPIYTYTPIDASIITPTPTHTHNMPPRRRRPPRPSALSSLPPLRILRSILLLQASYYLTALILILFTTLVLGQRFQLSLLLDWRAVRGDTTLGWIVGMCWLLTGFVTCVHSTTCSLPGAEQKRAERTPC